MMIVTAEGDIAFCKSEEEVRRDFQKLCECRAEDLVDTTKEWVPRVDGCPTPCKAYLYRIRRCGQLLSEAFHWPHRVQTATTWWPSGHDVLRRWQRDPDFLRGAYERLQRVSSGRRFTHEQLVYEAVRVNSALMTLTHFRATVSKHLCDTTRARRVLDVSAGWGDRLTGFLASESVQHISLIDPRPGSIRACWAQHAFVESDKEMLTRQAPAEEVLPTLDDACVDLVVTSPPYLDMEHYGETPEEAVGQIRHTAPTMDDYVRVFLRPVLTHIARVLAPGGLLALNLDDNERRGVFVCAPALAILDELPDMQLVGTAGLRKGGGFGQGKKGTRSTTLPKAEPIYLYRKT